MTEIRRLVALIALLVSVAAAPCWAWVYDAGQAQHAGLTVEENTACVWVSAPFTVEVDSYATSFGAALARAMGPVDSGFNVYLTTSMSGLPGSAIAKLPQPLVPRSTQYTYYDGALDEPLLLQAGTVYALVLMPTSPDLMASISYGVKPGTYYGYGTGDHGKTWYKLAYPVCVRVGGYAVPEPASLATLLPGFAIVVALRRRAR